MQQEVTQESSGEAIQWTASEFIDHHKSNRWYMNLAMVAVAVALLTLILTRDKITAVVILISAVALGFYGARQPRELNYQFDIEGFSIGIRRFTYSGFRSFTIDHDGAFSSITLLPLKRFAAAITLYYAPEHEERIATLLSRHLPYEARRRDPIDRLMKRIRF